mgnify:CR=1 FL=1
MLGPTGSGMGALLGQIGRRLTGENIPLMKVISNGVTESYYACQAKHVTVIELMQGESIMVESEDLLAFTDTVDYGLKPKPPSSVMVSPVIYFRSGEARATQARPMSFSVCP